MTEFCIREYITQTCTEDFEKLLTAYLSIWNTPENLKYLSFSLKEFREDTVRYWFSHHLDMGGRYFAISDSDEKITGIAVIKASPVEGFEINGFAISPDSKNSGRGKLLLRHCIDLALADGYHAVHGGVFTDNKPMLALLIKNDFIPTGIVHHACDDGRDIMHMKRYL